MEKKSISVLLVDDDEEEYLLLRDLLHRNTYTPALARMRIDWVNSYQAALPALASGAYDVALIDYHLGEQTGLDLLRVINQRELHLPVLLLTGQGSYDIDLAAMQEGAADYLLKGQFDAPLLERAVRYAIERRRAEDELKLRVHEREVLLERLSIEQNRLKAVIANAASGIVVTDAQGRVVLANPTAEQWLGSALQYGQPLQRLPGEAPELDFALERVAQDGLTCENLEVRLENTGEPPRYLLASATPIRDGHGHSSGAVGVLQDITARKQMEEQLQQQAARAQLLAVLSKAFAEAGLNDQAVLDTITHEIANRLADACLIQMVSEDGWLTTASASANLPGEGGALLETLKALRAPSDSGLAGHVLRTSTPVLLSGFTPQALAQVLPPEYTGWLREHTVHSLLFIPLWVKDRPFGVLLLARVAMPDPYTLEDLYFFEDLAGRAALAIENARLYEKVQQLSLTDPLTGLYNRRGLLSLSESELSRARRLKQQVTVVLLDIDFFKRVNDTHGHATGDEVLRAVAARLRAALRNQDVLARYGGEEFAILLPECCPVMGASIAERMRLLFENQPIQTQAGSISITVSLGLTVREPVNGDLNELLELADQALYRAKQGGRNRVEIDGA